MQNDAICECLFDFRMEKETNSFQKAGQDRLIYLLVMKLRFCLSIGDQIKETSAKRIRSSRKGIAVIMLTGEITILLKQ